MRRRPQSRMQAIKRDLQANCNYCHISCRDPRSALRSKRVGVAILAAWQARESKSKPTGWDRTRLGVLVPLGVVVAVAIVCIVVAALTSAQRADDVALERERQLLTRAIVNHGEWSLLRLKQRRRDPTHAVSAGDIDQSA